MVAGFIYLLGGGDVLVRGAVALARRAHVPTVVVAMSVVAFGTSIPELVVSLRATMTGYPGLILGNVVGSNIANVLLVGGVAAAVYPLHMRDRSVQRAGTVMLAISLIFAGFCLSGDVSRLEGGILLGGFAAVLAMSARATVKAYRAKDDAPPLDWVLGLPSTPTTIVAFILIGTFTLPLGADLLIEAAIEIAARFDVSDTVVGLSVVAIGTSLPEIATTVLAVLQRRPGVAVGTIVGSNTFNILGIMGITATMSGKSVPVSARFLSFDLPVMVGTSLALVVFARSGRSIGRKFGVALVVAYVVYLGALSLTV